MPAVHEEGLTKLGERTDVVITLPDVVEVEPAEIQNALILGGRQTLMFVWELVGAAEIELSGLDKVLQLPEFDISPKWEP
jgi:hypothetical protein